MRNLLLAAFIVSLPTSTFAADPGKEPDAERKAPVTLTCFIGGTMEPAIREITGIYGKKNGIEFEISSGDSGELIANIEGNKAGDIYVCHDPFMDQAMRKGLGEDAWTFAELVPVVVVQKGNPKEIKALKDFTRKDVDIVLTDYEYSTLGRMLPSIFNKAGIDFEKLNKDKNIPTQRSGGNAANIVKMKNADASIVWNVVALLRKDSLDIVPIDENLPVPRVDAITSATDRSYYLMPVRVTVTTLKASKLPAEAAKFAEFLSSDEEARAVLKKHGYKVDEKTCRKEYSKGAALPLEAPPAKEKPE